MTDAPPAVPRWFHVLAGLVLVLAGIFFALRLPKRPAPTILPAVPAEPVRVEVTSADRTLAIEKSSDGWRLTRPVPFPADEETVKEILGGLRDLSVEAVLTDRPETYALYALNESSAVTVTVSPASGGPVAWIFGKAAPDGARLFLKRPDAPEVFLAKGLRRSLLDSPPRQWRERRLFLHKPEDKVLRVVLTRDGRTYDLHKSSDEWRLGNREVDPEKAEAYLSDLDVLTADDFIDPPGSTDLKKFGLLSPRTTLTARTASGLTVELRAGRPEEDGRRVPLRRDNESTLFWIPDYAWTSATELPTATPSETR